MTNFSFRFIKTIAALVASIAVVALCSCAGVKTDSTAVTMGAVLPLDQSSPDYKTALNVQRGMLLAQKRINSRGGINGKRLDIVFKDSGKDAYETSQAVDSLVNSGVKFLHLGFTNQFVFEMPDLKNRKDVFINYLCSYPPAAVSNKNSVRIFLNAAQVAELMGKQYSNPHGEEMRIVIMNSSDNACKSAADYLSFEIKDEKTKIYRDVYSRNERNFDIFAAQIIRLKAPYFFNYGHGPEVEKLLLALAQKGFKGTFVTNCPEEPKRLLQTKDINLAAVYTDFQRGKLTNAESKDFVKAYMDEYGKSSPHWTAAYGYDSVMLFSKAYENSNADPVKAREFFLGKSFGAAIGKISFDAMGDSNSPLSVEK